MTSLLVDWKRVARLHAFPNSHAHRHALLLQTVVAHNCKLRLNVLHGIEVARLANPDFLDDCWVPHVSRTSEVCLLLAGRFFCRTHLMLEDRTSRRMYVCELCIGLFVKGTQSWSSFKSRVFESRRTELFSAV